MNATSPFNVAAGAMTYWSLGQQTDPDILRNGLGQLGLPDYAPKPRTWLTSLKAALAEMFAKPEELIRPLKHKNPRALSAIAYEGRITRRRSRSTVRPRYLPTRTATSARARPRPVAVRRPRAAGRWPTCRRWAPAP